MALYLVDFENVHDSGLSGVESLSEEDELFIFYSAKSEHMSFDTHVSIMKAPSRIKYIKLRRSAKNYLDFQLVTHLGFMIGSGAKGPYFIISKDTGFDSVIDYWKDHGVTVKRQPAIVWDQPVKKQALSLTPPAKVTIQQGKKIDEVADVSLKAEDDARDKAPSKAPSSKKHSKKQTPPKHSDEGHGMIDKTSKTEAEDKTASNSAEKTTAEQPNAVSETVSFAASSRPDSLPESYRKRVRTQLRGKNIPSANYTSIYKAILKSSDKLALNNLLVKTFGSSRGGEIYNLIKDIFIDFIQE